MSAPHPTVRSLSFVTTLAVLKLRVARRDQVALARAEMPPLAVERVRMSNIEVAIFIVVAMMPWRDWIDPTWWRPMSLWWRVLLALDHAVTVASAARIAVTISTDPVRRHHAPASRNRP